MHNVIFSITKIYIIILLLTCLNSICKAQSLKDESLTPRSFWGSIGLGRSSLGSIAVSIDGNVELKKSILFTAIAQGESNSFLDFSTRESKDVSTFDLLLGKIYKQKSTLITMSSGLGLIMVNTRTSSGGILYPSTNKKQSTIGIPLLFRAYGVAFRTVGIGIGFYSILNTIKTTAGVTFNVSIGRILPREKD